MDVYLALLQLFQKKSLRVDQTYQGKSIVRALFGPKVHAEGDKTLLVTGKLPIDPKEELAVLLWHLKNLRNIQYLKFYHTDRYSKEAYTYYKNKCTEDGVDPKSQAEWNEIFPLLLKGHEENVEKHFGPHKPSDYQWGDLPLGWDSLEMHKLFTTVLRTLNKENITSPAWIKFESSTLVPGTVESIHLHPTVREYERELDMKVNLAYTNIIKEAAQEMVRYGLLLNILSVLFDLKPGKLHITYGVLYVTDRDADLVNSIAVSRSRIQRIDLKMDEKIHKGGRLLRSNKINFKQFIDKIDFDHFMLSVSKYY